MIYFCNWSAFDFEPRRSRPPPHHKIKISGLFIASGVIAGAFGAHALKGSSDAYSLGVYEKGVFYHITQSVGLLCIAIAQQSGALTEKTSH